ncbi:alcohol dehydrogenase catalytic domain-containing protein [Streptomyces chartreusis]|uniref:2-deoxy-scyllo-inosamine dehydrogenase n=2 Tax=Streptomyces chartreusis TaxID=1969 RepID=A0A7H8TNQ0_STRCX|nr:alcohol dehydrogenase catalytic domain-containing protein [Streptomyces chartreusis]
MRAARLHERGAKLSVDIVDKPSPRSGDVLIEVKACGMIPNFQNTLDLPPGYNMPELPAIYGLDAAGVVVETGSAVRGVEVGQRVYVNPARYCTNCDACKSGHVMACDYAALNGYYGSGTKSLQILADYPYGGLADYMTAPPYCLVNLPDKLSFEMAARWGYMGTAYAALQRAKVDMKTTVLINGASGTLGLPAVQFALALGAPLILAVGRDPELLDRVRAIAPERIRVHSTTLSAQSIEDWARVQTNGRGAQVVLDALPMYSSPADFLAAAAALARGGIHVNPGGVFGEVAIDMLQAMNHEQTYATSLWFTPNQGQEMAHLAASGMLDLDVYEHEIYPLAEVNVAMERARTKRKGGFSNYVVTPG